MDKQWMAEEHERLIRVDQDIDSIAGHHRAHCDVCWDTDGGFCVFDDLLRGASAAVTKATVLNQARS